VARQCGAQQCEAAVEQNGHMAEFASGVSHDNTFPTSGLGGDSRGCTGDPLRPA
jgi:hypothetical protein